MHNTFDDAAKKAYSRVENCLGYALEKEKEGIGMMPQNQLLLYANGSNGAGKRLQKVVEELVPKGRLKVCRTIESFSQSLRRPWYGNTVAVLLAAGAKELEAFLFIRDLLSDVRIILILPDKEAETIWRGLKLYPRFFSYADSDFKVVAAVLSKMLSIHKYNI